MFASKVNQNQQQPREQQQVAQKQKQPFAAAQRTRSGASILDRLNILDRNGSSREKPCPLGADKPLAAQANHQNSKQDSSSTFNVKLFQQTQQLKAKLNQLQFGLRDDWQRALTKLVQAASKSTVKSRGVSTATASNLLAGSSLTRTTRKSAVGRQHSAANAAQLKLPSPRQHLQAGQPADSSTARLRSSASLDPRARTWMAAPSNGTNKRHQSLVRKSSAQRQQTQSPSLQTIKRNNWSTNSLQQRPSLTGSGARTASSDQLASLLDKSKSSAANKPRQINLARLIWWPATGKMDSAKGKTWLSQKSATTRATKASQSIMSLLSSATGVRHEKRGEGHRMPPLTGGTRLLFVATLQLLLLLVALTGSGIFIAVKAVPMSQFSAQMVRPIWLDDGLMRAPDSSPLDATSERDLAGAELAQGILSKLQAELQDNLEPSAVGQQQLKAESPKRSWFSFGGGGGGGRQRSQAESEPSLEEKRTQSNKPQELFLIERRRLNRDRALEPPVWLRTRPIRADESSSEAGQQSSGVTAPPIDDPTLAEEAESSIEDDAASRPIRWRFGRGRQLRESHSELYHEILKQLVEEALAGRSFLDDLYEDLEARSKPSSQRGGGGSERASASILASSEAATNSGYTSQSPSGTPGPMKDGSPSSLLVDNSKGQLAADKQQQQPQEEALVVAGDDISDPYDVTLLGPEAPETGAGTENQHHLVINTKPLLALMDNDSNNNNNNNNNNKLQDFVLVPTGKQLDQQYDRLTQSAPSAALAESLESLETDEHEGAGNGPVNQQHLKGAGAPALTNGQQQQAMSPGKGGLIELVQSTNPMHSLDRQLLMDQQPPTPQEESFHVVEDIDQADSSQEIPVLVVGGIGQGGEASQQEQAEQAADSLGGGLARRSVEQAEPVGGLSSSDIDLQGDDEPAESAGSMPMKRGPAHEMARPSFERTQTLTPSPSPSQAIALEAIQARKVKARAQLETVIKLIKAGYFTRRQLVEMANKLKFYLEGALQLPRDAIDGLFPVNSQQLLVELNMEKLNAFDRVRLAENFEYRQDSSYLVMNWPVGEDSPETQLDNPLPLLLAILSAMNEDDGPSPAALAERMQLEEAAGGQINEPPLPLLRVPAVSSVPSDVVSQWNLDQPWNTEAEQVAPAAALSRPKGDPETEDTAGQDQQPDWPVLLASRSPPPRRLNKLDPQQQQRRPAQALHEEPLSTADSSFGLSTTFEGFQLGDHPTRAWSSPAVDSGQWSGQGPIVYPYQPSLGRPNWRMMQSPPVTYQEPQSDWDEYYAVARSQKQQQQQHQQVSLAAFLSSLGAIYGWGALQPPRQQQQQPYLSQEQIDYLSGLSQRLALLSGQLGDGDMFTAASEQQDAITANSTQHHGGLFDVLTMRHEHVQALVWFQLTAILLALFGSFLIVKLLLRRLDKSVISRRRLSNLTSFSSSTFSSKVRLWSPFSGRNINSNVATKEHKTNPQDLECCPPGTIKGETVSSGEKQLGLGHAAGLHKRGLSNNSVDSLNSSDPNSEKIRRNFDLLAHRLASFLSATSKSTPEDSTPPSGSSQVGLEKSQAEGATKTAKDERQQEQQQFRSSTSYIKSLIEALTKAASAQMSGATFASNQVEDDDDEDELLTRSASRTGRHANNSSSNSNSPGSKQQRLFVEEDDEVLMSQMDISAAHLILDYMEKHLVDKERLRREWLELNAGSKLMNNSHKANQLMMQRLARIALNEENLHKNRNPNVAPFDRNRVRLGACKSDQLTSLTKNSSGNGGRTGRRNNKSQWQGPSDYINASFIYDDDPRRPSHIIAQGPKEQTCGQFWQMVWEQEISVIVMLTRLNENGNQMCHCYWPTSVAGNPSATAAPDSTGAVGTPARRGSVTSVFSGSVSHAAAVKAHYHASTTTNQNQSLGGPIVAGAELDDNVLYFEVVVPDSGSRQTSLSSTEEEDEDRRLITADRSKTTQATPGTIKLEVHLISEHVSSSDYLVRNMYLINRTSGEARTISQFHYLAWQDGRTPENVRSFLQFRRKVHKSYRNLGSPILVHCNDGAGRSGTYTLIDIILERIKNGAKEIDLRATLEHLRDQRVGLCETQSQFEFVLVALAEEIQVILNALPR